MQTQLNLWLLNFLVYANKPLHLSSPPTATDWVVANEDLTPTNRYCIKNLTAGDLLHVRVVAVNPGGRSEPGILAGPVPIREIVGK